MTDTSTSPRAAGAGRGPQAGPPLLAPIGAFAVTTIAYVIANRNTPHPDASGAAVLLYAQAHGTAAKVGALLMLSSAVPLALGTAVFYRRLRALGITAPGSAITLVGGVLAAVALALSSIFAWTSGQLPADAPPALARALADLSFLSGGPMYAATFAMLVAGISVTSLFAGVLPRALAWVGLLLAVAGMVSLLTLVAASFGYLLPLVRFGGLIWLVFVAALLPHTRHRAQAASNT